MRRLVVFAVCATTFAMALASGSAFAAQKARVDGPLPQIGFGFNGEGPLYRESSTVYGPLLERLRASGVTEVRDHFYGDENNTPSGYDWSHTDLEVAALARAGIRFFPSLTYGMSWHGPFNTENYLALVRQAIDRYGLHGIFWDAHPDVPRLPVLKYEILNEADAPWIYPWAPDARTFARVYTVARLMIHADGPGTQAVTGGMVELKALPYLRRAYLQGHLRGQVDAISLHPYMGSGCRMYGAVRAVRRLLNRLDPGVPLQLTETGISATEMPEAERATEFSKYIQAVLSDRSLNVTAIDPYSIMSPESVNQWWAHLGLFNHDGTSKPTGDAYLKSIATAPATRRSARSFTSCEAGAAPTLIDQALTSTGQIS